MIHIVLLFVSVLGSHLQFNFATMVLVGGGIFKNIQQDFAEDDGFDFRKIN